MKKIIITYGVIAGAIVSVMLVLSMPMHETGVLNYDSGMVVGYASMVVALSFVFFGIKNYRDNHLNGEISFWQAFKVGIGIALIASLLYCITWEVCYHTIASDFMARMSDYYVSEKIAEGATPEEVEATREKMAEFEKNYESPLIRFGMTLFEILPVGLVVTLVSAALLKRKKFLPVVPPSEKS